MSRASRKSEVLRASPLARSRLTVAGTYEGGDRALLERLTTLVDYIEITPDSISRFIDDKCVLNEAYMAELQSVAGQVRFLVHGVGLSIASADKFSEDYIHALDALFERLTIDWHSEHLAYTMVEGQHLGTMLSPLRTQETLDLLSKRIEFLQKRYAVPFLLEHVADFLPEREDEFSLAGFMNAIADRTRCQFVLDAYNLECDRTNGALDLDQFFDELDMKNVRELHIAGGGYYKGFRVDVHAEVADANTNDLARMIVDRAPSLRTVTFEFLPQAIPLIGHEAICRELMEIRERFCA